MDKFSDVIHVILGILMVLFLIIVITFLASLVFSDSNEVIDNSLPNKYVVVTKDTGEVIATIPSVSAKDTNNFVIVKGYKVTLKNQ